MVSNLIKLIFYIGCDDTFFKSPAVKNNGLCFESVILQASGYQRQPDAHKVAGCGRKTYFSAKFPRFIELLFNQKRSPIPLTTLFAP